MLGLGSTTYMLAYNIWHGLCIFMLLKTKFLKVMTLSKPIRFKIESRFSLFVVISWLLMSCIEPDSINSCNFENPLEEISWLREIVNTLEASMDSVGYEIIRYDYKGSTVFYVNDCFGCSDGIIRVYNCEGEVICEFGGTHGINSCPDFLETATDSTILLDGVTRIKQTSGFLIFSRIEIGRLAPPIKLVYGLPQFD